MSGHMSLEEIPPVLREALCIFSALRTLGFPSDDINVIFQKMPGDGHDVYVQLSKRYSTASGKIVTFRAGSVEGDVDEHHDVLVRFCGLPDELRESIVSRLYPESNVGRNQFMLVSAIVAHGVTPPWREEGE